MMGPLNSGSRVVGERGTYVVGSKPPAFWGPKQPKEGGMGYVHWGLLDFGAAKQGYLHGIAQYGLGTIVASEGWTAPEQMVGEATEASDIYALGTTLFFLLTGKEPRQFMRHDGALLKGPRDVNPSVSGEISEVILRASKPDPRLRPQTAEDVRKLLKGTYAPIGVPNIVLAGRTYTIQGNMEIGRVHSCDQTRCRIKRHIDIPINDPGNYVSRHHARTLVDKYGRCWVEDINDYNFLAVSRKTFGWYQLPKHSQYELKDKDIVALVYAAKKGPYMTFTFNEK
jgi:serine/threonine protein kinase